MARIRTIKPEFFTSSDIVSITPLARLFYISLWCESDREGRLDWKPKTFKLRYFPGDNCEIDDMAKELIAAGLIILYEVNGEQLAEIPTFKSHQVINNREAESQKPSRVNHASTTRESGDQAEGKEGREGKGRKEGENPPDGGCVLQSKPPVKPNCPHQEIINLYHTVLPSNPMIRDWTPARAELLRARWNEDSKRQNLEYWKSFFDYVAGSPFLTGKKTGKDGRAFAPGLDWLLKAENFAKVREGRYEDTAA